MTLKRLVLLLSLLLTACTSPNTPPKTAAAVDLTRYMGKWYEIASFPNFFQRGCVCTTAQYTLEGNKVQVLNQCYKDKKLTSAKGIAWAMPGTNNSKLKVQFFWPFRGDYWILYLSSDYSAAIVGSPKRQYLWILARKPQITNQLYQKLIKIAQSKGFDTSKLVKTEQTCHLS